MSHILSVTDLTQALKDVLEAEFPFVWVRGQVTNLARPGSGHLYFTLSDSGAALPVVWFKNSQGRGGRGGSGSGGRPGGEAIDPLTGEVLEPGRDVAAELADGQEVLAAGRVTVYAARGAYQLVAELVQQSGVSDLALAFEALKHKLEAKGYFDAARKRPIAPSPARVALITSPQGAAVRDFLRLAQGRGTGASIRIHPALVQGAAAPAQLAAQLDAVNADGWAEVVALIRGGGSLEDLWAFNTEVVAEAVFRSRIPVVTGVGHEPDVSIADYVADRRFATPSAVASGLWPLRADLMQAVDGLEADLARAFAAHLERKDRQLSELRRALSWLSPARRLARLDEAWVDLSRRLAGAGGRLLSVRRERLAAVVRHLSRAFGPAAVCARQEQVQALSERASLSAGLALAGAGRQVEVLAARLAGLDPEGPLRRGYSLVRVERTGRFLRSTAEVAPGDRLGVRTADGEVAAVVAEAEKGRI
ncbi:MAG: exodeoxyribonuclease VII large subunit [Proteobacteria bacterium]|nr:exodeoxyribonuclease VII large subunit [Pseudomonadota bacterium]MBU1595974.1 exodeoxyribonuclease VII large subunit [Pseudomonadota bacterium]